MFLKILEGGNNVDGSSAYVKKVLEQWQKSDEDAAAVDEAVANGEEVSFPTSEYVRLLKERGQINDA